jgi:ATP-dependent Clp protease ATP-binding subunit ClpX
MGFGADVKATKEKDLVELYSHLHPDDLNKYGLIPEFIGRVPIHVTLNELSKEDLKKIITEPKNSVIRQYQSSLKIDGVQLEFEEDAIDAIAEKAIAQRTGARGLRSIVEGFMMDIMFEIPSIEGEKQVIINRDVIENSSKPEIVYKKKTA